MSAVRFRTATCPAHMQCSSRTLHNVRFISDTMLTICIGWRVRADGEPSVRGNIAWLFRISKSHFRWKIIGNDTWCDYTFNLPAHANEINKNKLTKWQPECKLFGLIRRLILFIYSLTLAPAAFVRSCRCTLCAWIETTDRKFTWNHRTKYDLFGLGRSQSLPCSMSFYPCGNYVGGFRMPFSSLLTQNTNVSATRIRSSVEFERKPMASVKRYRWNRLSEWNGQWAMRSSAPSYHQRNEISHICRPNSIYSRVAAENVADTGIKFNENETFIVGHFKEILIFIRLAHTIFKMQTNAHKMDVQLPVQASTALFENRKWYNSIKFIKTSLAFHSSASCHEPCYASLFLLSLTLVRAFVFCSLPPTMHTPMRTIATMATVEKSHRTILLIFKLNSENVCE